MSEFENKSEDMGQAMGVYKKAVWWLEEGKFNACFDSELLIQRMEVDSIEEGLKVIDSLMSQDP